VCGPDGIAVFDAMHRRRGAADAVLQAFDLLETGKIFGRCHSRSERRGWRGFWHVSMSGLPISALEMPPAARMATRSGGRHGPKCPLSTRERRRSGRNVYSAADLFRYAALFFPS
jgi:hypothetical protein